VPQSRRDSRTDRGARCHPRPRARRPCGLPVPVGSPDGRFAFLHASLGAAALNQVASLGGGGAVPAGQHAIADWSPDGRRFVYESDHGIYSTAADGLSAILVTIPLSLAAFAG
jgi:hypothetical protein